MPLIIPVLHTSTRKSFTEAIEINGVALKPMFDVTGLTTSVSMVRAGLSVTYKASPCAVFFAFMLIAV
jgi:hypothetical protein